MMDDDEFDDLLAEVEMIPSSQAELLTAPPIEIIETIFEGMADALSEKHDHFSVELKTRPRSRKVHLEVNTAWTPNQQDQKHELRFPGRTPNEAWKFTITVRILELMHEALRAGIVISKRDIYYRDPALFGSQARVDRYVDDIAYTFNVPRAQLNVTAVAKGLIAGAFSMCRRDGSTIDTSSDQEGMLVPSVREILSLDERKVKWILVVEKEASFRSIVASTFWDLIASEGIVITGKGYPDLATRAMLRHLSFPSPQNGFCSPPVYGLVDFDPDGLAILSVYKNGSIALAHENDGLNVPQLQWLGLRKEHVAVLSDDLHATQGLLKLSTMDRKKARKMLETGQDAEVQAALQQMLLLNLKAELQILDAGESGMTKLLRSSLLRLDS